MHQMYNECSKEEALHQGMGQKEENCRLQLSCWVSFVSWGHSMINGKGFYNRISVGE